MIWFCSFEIMPSVASSRKRRAGGQKAHAFHQRHDVVVGGFDARQDALVVFALARGIGEVQQEPVDGHGAFLGSRGDVAFLADRFQEHVEAAVA